MRHHPYLEATAYYGLTAILISLIALMVLCAPAFV